MTERKPGNLLAAWFNIVACGALVILGVSFAVTTSAFGYLVAAGAAAMEIFFVRTLVEIHKERLALGDVRVTENRHENEHRPEDDSKNGGGADT